MTTLAPYHNAMRLGQGFNSYTQQICINEAVTVDRPPVTITPPSQIVTYSSRYVSKISDVTNSMNISGALNIKYGMVSGGASGSFIDSSKFQQSDINFLVTVKVVNQTQQADPEALVFKPLLQQGVASAGAMTSEQFTKKFGDCFISGFQEGGEFYGLISIKVLETTKKTDILAEAHVSLQASFEVSGKVNVNLTNSDWQKSCETTITVNWSGGGKLKESTDKWDIESMSAVAAKFPDLVAATPQRTTAILTKYSNLRSYAETQPPTLLPLQYENASLYTTELMDSFIAYKTLWKNMQITLDEYDSGLVKLTEPHNTTGVEDPSDPTKKIGPYTADLPGLDDGIRQVRLQMLRIVNEVDLVTGMPRIASDPEHGIPYIRPQIFKHLLPGGCADAPSPLADFTPPFEVYDPRDPLLRGSTLAFITLNRSNLAVKRLKFSRLIGNPSSTDETISSASYILSPSVSDNAHPLQLADIGSDSDTDAKAASFTATYRSELVSSPGTTTYAIPGPASKTSTSNRRVYPVDGSGDPLYVTQVVFNTWPTESKTDWLPLFAILNGPKLPPTAPPAANVAVAVNAPEGFALVGWWGTRNPASGKATAIGCVWGEVSTWFPKSKLFGPH